MGLKDKHEAAGGRPYVSYRSGGKRGENGASAHPTVPVRQRGPRRSLPLRCGEETFTGDGTGVGGPAAG